MTRPADVVLPSSSEEAISWVKAGENSQDTRVLTLIRTSEPTTNAWGETPP
eukprot:CAMPEP_0206512562 /NCGR_PEP_ID=MMETSP0324_2-20121206/60968_1 /ASSEMBLY_ACC=CAM_ASM_000836 /TAXON_ID=2866 /ORGANISM="Crypthecodinium cohnii, Strain Seligo" /LENGTH=50 /DNA_ID=CAMNT_0054004573 /DNA_START=204 /DNA_END=356 /DNA_ORIENTATION=+